MPRRLVGERMDDPSLPAREHAHALAGLARLNTLSGTARAIYRRIAPLAASLGRPVTVLDVATGSGDLPIALMRRASKDGLMLSCTGCDVSRRALRRAQARARRHGVPLRTVRLDALAEPLPTADVVTCALFLHHLTDRQAADLLARMAEAADRLLVVSDLRRGAWCTALAAVVPRLTTTSRVVHVDALRSARAAWTMRELHALIRDNTEIRDDTNAGRWTFRRALARAYADHMAASGPSGSFDCDAVVIGAGPAGCVAAWRLVRAGLKTTLIERCEPGRAKVCGCCLGALGRATLQGLGLHDVLRSAGPLHTLRLVTHGRQASLPLRGFVSVARESFDHDLARRAEAAGADVHWLTRAQASPDGTVRLSTGRTLRARVVVDASGLSGSALTLDGGRALAGGGESVAPRSRMGLGLVGVGGASRPGELVMAVGRHGYVGMVALPDGRTDLAAAMDPHAVRSAGGPARAVGALWRSAGLDAGDLPAADRWRGTPRLTRRRPAQEGRILRVGDAAGYVEPFTGEGMSWAIVASSAVLEDCLACVRDGPAASRWPKRLAGLLGGRQRRCRLVCRAVRMPTLVAAGVRLAGLGPAWWSAALVARSCGAGPLA